MSRVMVPTAVRRYSDGTFVSRPDSVAGEEPLEVRVGGQVLTVTMRTPGHDIELVHGFLHAEGVIADAADVRTIRYCDGVDESGRNTYNVLDVTLADPAAAQVALADAKRSGVTSSSCGVCGSASIEALHAATRHPLRLGAPRLSPDQILALPEQLRTHQRGFAKTGGLHAAGLANAGGTVTLVREDIGRHNAVDKVIGAALTAEQVPLVDQVLVVSSRASFELVQKALMAGIGILVAVSAPSSLAVELAASAGMTLIGFTRGDSFNLYTGAERIRGA